MACEIQVAAQPGPRGPALQENVRIPGAVCVTRRCLPGGMSLRDDPSPESATSPGRGRCAGLSCPRRAVAACPDLSDRSCEALDGAQTAVFQRGGEVAGFQLEVGDEGLQPDRAGRQREQRLHYCGRLAGEVVPLLDLETREI